MLSSAYGAAATWRRRWYARDPARVRRLGVPVVSVGNLTSGGSGKTPIVAHLARVLVAHGERPAILSRGYARTAPQQGVTVVSGLDGVRAPLETSGDEPLMLARALPGVPVLVGTDRFECGRVAERDFHATVHLLDDGFQHVRLARDVDLLLVDESDLQDHVLPEGRLREPLANAVAADAVLVTNDDRGGVERVARTLGVTSAFGVRRRLGAPQLISGGELDSPPSTRIVASAGIARPERFFSDLSAVGWTVGATLAFPDHHPYTPADVERIAAKTRDAQAPLVLTTEKDAVRLGALDLGILRVGVVPLTTEIEPVAAFAAWLLAKLQAARGPA